MEIAFVAGLGLIAGSFLNALLFRYRTGASVLAGRSQCMRCGHALGALDLVPVLSYALLGGRCRYCGARISPQYPLVELGAAVLLAGTWVLYPEPLWFAFWALVHLTLLFIFVYDLRHKIIPTSALLLFLGLCLLYAWSIGFAPWSMAGGLLAVPFLLCWVASRGRAMGFADAPLELGLGVLLGLSAGLTALFLAVWAGALVGIALVIGAKGYRMKSELPLGPFLIAGAWVVHFFHVDFFPLLPYLF